MDNTTPTKFNVGKITERAVMNDLDHVATAAERQLLARPVLHRLFCVGFRNWTSEWPIGIAKPDIDGRKSRSTTQNAFRGPLARILNPIRKPIGMTSRQRLSPDSVVDENYADSGLGQR